MNKMNKKDVVIIENNERKIVDFTVAHISYVLTYVMFFTFLNVNLFFIFNILYI